MSKYNVRILVYWYVHQTMPVQWGNSVSAPCGVGNGGRQGGILPPVFFSLYIDYLSKQLKACNTGCMIGDIKYNASESVIIIRISLLYVLCVVWNMILNIMPVRLSSQSVEPKRTNVYNVLTLNSFDTNLSVCNKVKYLTNFITEFMTDDEDIYRQGHMMYAQANILFSLVCG